MALVKKMAAKPVFSDERKQKRDCPGLLEELSSQDPTARRWAARDLVGCPESAHSLVERLKVETEISVREVILTTLTHLDDPSVMAALVDCLRSEDAALRNEVIEAMGEMHDSTAPTIRELLLDSDPDVRIFAVNIIESLRHPDVEAWLLQVIETDPHVNVCATAVDLLSEVGTEAALAPLERLKARFAEEPYIHFAADLALKRIRGS